MFFTFLFFVISLIGLSLLIGRKLALIHRGVIVVEERDVFTKEFFEALGEDFWTSAKRYGYIALVEIIRIYLRGLHVLRRYYFALENKVKDAYRSRMAHKEQEGVSENKFLKAMGTY